MKHTESVIQSDPLVGHDARTVPEMGWASKRVGELLPLAERAFDVFLTVDQTPVAEAFGVQHRGDR